jgi:HlyD family secretion protein
MFGKKKRMESLKIQDVSADCPSYIEEKEKVDSEETSAKNQTKKSQNKKNKKKRKMRKVRAKKRNPFVAILIFLLVAAAGAAGFYFFGIPLLGGSSKVYVSRVSNIMGLGSGNGTLNRYAGLVESQGEWTVKADGDRRVKEVYVNVGDNVNQGDPLFAYDAEEIALNLEQAKLELERMQSEYAAAESPIASLEAQKAGLTSGEQMDIEIQIQSLQANNKKTEYDI